MAFLAPLATTATAAATTAAASAGTFLASGAGMALTTGISAVGTLAAGAAQKRQYEQQAAQAELRGRSQAIAYKQKGSEALRRLNETLSAIVAGFLISSSGIPASTLPTRSAPTSAAFV